MDNAVVYIGDFDFRNENVQSHLVKNNGKILNFLGYHVEYIGVDRKEGSFEKISALPPVRPDNGNRYYELPETLNIKGLFNTPAVCRAIIARLDELKKQYKISHVITYQSPTYAVVLKKIVTWCRKNNAAYIVNCADLPIFKLQSLLRRIVMNVNWSYLHRINRKYADGVIAVSDYIADFYSKPERPVAVIPPLSDVSPQRTDIDSNEIPTFIYAGTPFVITGKAADPKGMKDRLDFIVDIMLKLEDKNVPFRFDIAGITLEDYCMCIPRHEKRVKASENIVFRGRQSHADTLTRLANADYMINYRDKNLMTVAGMSTKVVESVSVGTPVVMNDIGDTFRYLEDGVSGIRLSGNIGKDAATLETLCRKSAADRMKNKEKTRSKRVFSTERYVQGMQTFLEQVLNTRRYSDQRN